MADVLVRLVNLVDEFLDADVVLAGVREALVERLLQGGVGLAELRNLFFQACHAGVRCCQLLFGALEVGLQLLVILLACHEVFLACTAGEQHGCCQ